MNAIKDAGLDKQPELYQKLQQGVFTLRDMYEQFQNVMKMGPLGKVMSMIPGMSAMMTKGKENESQQRFKKVRNAKSNPDLVHRPGITL